MDERTTISHLEALAYSLGLDIRYERIVREEGFYAGGFCRVGGRQFIIIDSSATNREKIITLVHALKRFDLSRVYVKPAVRDMLKSMDDNREDE